MGKSIEDNFINVKQTIPNNVKLVAVSKTKPISDLEKAYNLGLRDFGENKVQEMCEKYEVLPKDIRWHMIGHLQTNKVKYMAPFVYLVHGVDSFRLLIEINKQAKRNNRIIKILLQQFIADEETKFGLNEVEIRDIMENEVKNLQNIQVVGLMGMATFTKDEEKIRNEFKVLKSNYDYLKSNYEDITILSMGMSGDYKIAIEEGSNMVRIGSSIFGSRI